MLKNEYIKGLKVIHLIICIGLILFNVIAYFLIKSGMFLDQKLDLGEYNVYVYLLGGIFLLMANAVGKGAIIQKIDTLPSYANVDDRLKTYKEGYLLSLGLLGIPSIILSVFGMMMGEVNLLLMSIMGIILLFFKRPKWESVKDIAKFSPKEIENLDK